MNNSKIKIIVFLFFSCANYNCTKNYENEINLSEVNLIFQESIKLLDNYYDEKKPKAYIVIPNVGCNGCISQAEQLLKDEVDNPHNIKFILTNIESLKSIKIKLGLDVNNYQNIIVDKNNLFSKDGLRSIYPRVFFINEAGEIFKVVEISPFEDGIDALHEFTMSNN